MNGPLNDSVRESLSALDQEIRKRTSLARAGYSFGLAGGITLYVFFPFQLSRVGSVILIVALAQMIWKVYEAGRQPALPNPELVRQPGAGTAPSPAQLQAKDLEVEREQNRLWVGLGKVDAQIRLNQSVIFNLPFMVGANLFFMGLPGTGSPETKALLDCLFLFGTVILFSALYVANQKTVRKQLLPLRQELERRAGASSMTNS